MAEILKRADAGASMASWAIRFAADLDGVLTVLSGMSDLAQMEDNLSFMKGFTGLSDAERRTLEEARRELARIPLIPCTTCNYCAKVCPVEECIGFQAKFYKTKLSEHTPDLKKSIRCAKKRLS